MVKKKKDESFSCQDSPQLTYVVLSRVYQEGKKKRNVNLSNPVGYLLPKGRLQYIVPSYCCCRTRSDPLLLKDCNAVKKHTEERCICVFRQACLLLATVVSVRVQCLRLCSSGVAVFLALLFCGSCQSIPVTRRLPVRSLQLQPLARRKCVLLQGRKGSVTKICRGARAESRRG